MTPQVIKGDTVSALLSIPLSLMQLGSLGLTCQKSVYTEAAMREKPHSDRDARGAPAAPASRSAFPSRIDKHVSEPGFKGFQPPVFKLPWLMPRRANNPLPAPPAPAQALPKLQIHKQNKC